MVHEVLNFEFTFTFGSDTVNLSNFAFTFIVISQFTLDQTLRIET